MVDRSLEQCGVNDLEMSDGAGWPLCVAKVYDLRKLTDETQTHRGHAEDSQ